MKNDGKWVEEARSNASTIEREIENLRDNHLDSNAPLFTTRYHYREFWSHAKEVSEMFKSLKLLREDRERLWGSYQSICEDVKRKQNEEQEESSRNREIIESLITDAYYQAEGSGDKEDLDKAKSMQSETLQLMKERRLFREDREHCWKYWREVNEKIHWKRHSLWESNFLHAKEDASRCLNTAHYGDPYEALGEIKEVQRSLRGVYISKDQRHEIYDTLGDAWNKSTSRIGEIKEEKRRKHEAWLQRQEERKRKHEEWLHRKEERERKYQEWRERMESNIERWENNIEKAEHAISKIEANIDKLEDMAANARTDEYADRVRGWIDENYQRVQDIRESIREWESKIYSAKGKLSR